MSFKRVLMAIGMAIMSVVGIVQLLAILLVIVLGGFVLWLAFTEPEGTPSGGVIIGIVLMALGVLGLVKLWRDGPSV